MDGCLPAEFIFRCVARSGPHEPAVVVEPLEGQVYVVAANDQARELGIARGSKLNAALALAASLKVLERSPRIERAHLESLAAWTQTLTPTVSIEPPETLLLEVSGSIKLFHSLAAIKQRLEEKIASIGLVACASRLRRWPLYGSLVMRARTCCRSVH